MPLNRTFMSPYGDKTMIDIGHWDLSIFYLFFLHFLRSQMLSRQSTRNGWYMITRLYSYIEYLNTEHWTHIRWSSYSRSIATDCEQQIVGAHFPWKWHSNGNRNSMFICSKLDTRNTKKNAKFRLHSCEYQLLLLDMRLKWEIFH